MTISVLRQAGDALKFAARTGLQAQFVVKGVSNKVKQTATALIGKMKAAYIQCQKKKLLVYCSKALIPLGIEMKKARRTSAAKAATPVAQCVLAAKELADLREVRANRRATTVQALFRRNKVQPAFRGLKKAAIQLQARVRQDQAQKRLKAKQTVAAKLQPMVRGVRGRKEAAIRKSSAHIIGRFMKSIHPVKGDRMYKSGGPIGVLSDTVNTLEPLVTQLREKADQMKNTWSSWAGFKMSVEDKGKLQKIENTCDTIESLSKKARGRILGSTEIGGVEEILRALQPVAIKAVELIEQDQATLPSPQEAAALHLALRNRVIRHNNVMDVSWGRYHRDSAQQLSQRFTPKEHAVIGEQSRLYDALPLEELYKRAFWTHLNLGHSKELEPELKANIAGLTKEIERQEKALDRLAERAKECKALDAWAERVIPRELKARRYGALPTPFFRNAVRINNHFLMQRALTNPISEGASQREIDGIKIVRDQMKAERSRRVKSYHQWQNQIADHMRAQLYKVKGGLL